MDPHAAASQVVGVGWPPPPALELCGCTPCKSWGGCPNPRGRSLSYGVKCSPCYQRCRGNSVSRLAAGGPSSRPATGSLSAMSAGQMMPTHGPRFYLLPPTLSGAPSTGLSSQALLLPGALPPMLLAPPQQAALLQMPLEGRGHLNRSELSPSSSPLQPDHPAVVRVVPDGPLPPDMDLGELHREGLVYGVALSDQLPSPCVAVALQAATQPGSGKLNVSVRADNEWQEAARVASLCARRLVSKYGLRQLWTKKLDLCIGAPRCFMTLQQGSSAAAVAMAVLQAASSEPSRRWGVTGLLTLGGKVCAVGGVREKAVAAWMSGLKGMVLPRENLSDLTAPDWPVEQGDAPPSAELRQKWEAAKGQLLFKTVEDVEELALFLFPGLAGAEGARGGDRAGGKRRRVSSSGGSKAGAVTASVPGAGSDIGPVSQFNVLRFGAAEAATVEACLVLGAQEPVVTGGKDGAGAVEMGVALRLLHSLMGRIETLARGLGQTGGLRYDPRKPCDSHPHVHVHPPEAPWNGLLTVPMLVTLASLASGLQARRDCAVLAFCTVGGQLLLVGDALDLIMKDVTAQGFTTLFVHERDVERAQRLAGDAVQVRGVRHVRDLFKAGGGGLWAARR